MSTKQLVAGTVAGGVVFFLLGYLIWGLAFAGFFENNAVGSVSLMKDPPDFLMLGIGQLGFGALLTVIFGKWASISTASTGAQAGALIGLLTAIGVDMTFYGTMSMYNLTATLVDVALITAQAAVAGGVIGAVLGMTQSS